MQKCPIHTLEYGFILSEEKYSNNDSMGSSYFSLQYPLLTMNVRVSTFVTL